MTRRGNNRNSLGYDFGGGKLTKKHSSIHFKSSKGGSSASITPPRRSARLKSIKALYESDASSSSLNQPDCIASSSLSVNQVKVEVTLEDSHANDDTGSSYTVNFVSTDRNSDSNEPSITTITLKDLQTRSKANKWKFLKSNSSLKADHKSHSSLALPQKQDHAHLKPKEEESDLDEPLISLKLKQSGKCSTGRKQKRCAQVTEDYICVGDTKAPSTSDICLKSEIYDVSEEDPGGLAMTSFTKTEHSLPPAVSELKRETFHSCSYNSLKNIKREIMDSDSQDVQNTIFVDSSSEDFIAKRDSCAVSEWPQEDDGGDPNQTSVISNDKVLHLCSNDSIEVTSHISPQSISKLETDVGEDDSELLCNVQDGILEVDSQLSDHPIYLAESGVGFIAKYSCSVNLSMDPEGGDKHDSETAEITCANEISTLHGEPGKYALPQCVEEVVHAGSLDTISAMVVSPGKSNSMDEHDVPFGDLHVHPVNYLSDSGIVCGQNVELTCSSIKKIEYYGNLAGEIEVQDLFSCNFSTDQAIDNTICVDKSHAFDDSSESCKEVECLGNLVEDVFRQDTFSHTVDNSTEEAYDLCSQQLTICLSAAATNLRIINNGLQETRSISSSLEKMPNLYDDKVSCDSTESSIPINFEEAREAPDCHSPQPSLCSDTSHCLRFTNGSSSEVAENILSSVMDKETSATIYKPADSSIEVLPSSLQENNAEEELNFGHTIGLEHHPEKLLSKRKRISPTSQEKLCQSLNGIDLYDALQSSKMRKRLLYDNLTGKEVESTELVSKETRWVPGSERVTKKLKNGNEPNGSPPSINKGILKPSDTPYRSPCTCARDSLINKQAEKAITFSRRQMHDIELLAVKLLKGLESMKNVVERTNYPEACMSEVSHFSADEIKLALENASNLEEHTKKWLSMMSRDCTRFCKIMRMGEQKAAPVNKVCKEGRRISFADESSGKLCHVKAFE